MTSEQSPPSTPDEAWQRLVGTWCYRFEATNSLSESRLRFTPDRKLKRSNSLSGGVLPMPMTSETTTEVTKVALNMDAILLTLGANSFGRAGAVLTLRFAAADRIALEDGPTFTREA